MMQKDDLKRVAPLWLQFSKAVRHDPDVRHFHPMPLHVVSTPFTTMCRFVSPSRSLSRCLLASLLQRSGDCSKASIKPPLQPVPILIEIVHLWVSLSMQAWNLTGDSFTHNPGDKPWISEM